MALDVFVMPMSRYLAGDYETRLERFAAETSAGYHRTAPKPNAPIDEAKAFVARLRRELREHLGPDIRWRDDGEIEYSRQFPRDLWHALRAFAADQTQPVPGFAFDEQSHKHPGLARIWIGAARSPFLHLIRHHDHQGFYLPTDFREPFRLELTELARPWTGSSLALLRELNHLGRILRMARDEGQEGWTDQFMAGDPLLSVKSGWAILRHCARISVASKLPIVFDG